MFHVKVTASHVPFGRERIGLSDPRGKWESGNAALLECGAIEIPEIPVRKAATTFYRRRLYN